MNFAKCFSSLILTACLGCGPSGPPMYNISGTVQLESKAISKGTVTFEDSDAGFAATGNIQPDGKYSLKLREGSYRVMLLPLFKDTIAGDGTPVSLPVDPKSIPQKYQSPERSGLKLDVKQDSVFDIELKK